MSDLVERLHACEPKNGHLPRSKFYPAVDYEAIGMAADEIDRLTLALAESEKRVAELQVASDAADEANQALFTKVIAEHEAAEAKLAKYGRHTGECDLNSGNCTSESRCTCGFDAAVGEPNE